MIKEKSTNLKYGLDKEAELKCLCVKYTVSKQRLVPHDIIHIEVRRSGEQAVGVNTSISQVIGLFIVCSDTSHSYFSSFLSSLVQYLLQ